MGLKSAGQQALEAEAALREAISDARGATKDLHREMRVHRDELRVMVRAEVKAQVEEALADIRADTARRLEEVVDGIRDDLRARLGLG